MSKSSNTNTAHQMIAMGEMLIKKATELKNGQSPKGTGPRKGLTDEQRQMVITRRLKVAIKN